MRRLIIGGLVLIGLLAILSPQPLMAGDSLEAELQQQLKTSCMLIDRMVIRHDNPAEMEVLLKRFASLTEKVYAVHLLLLDRFENRQARVKVIGPNASRRHLDMVADYRRKIEPYLELARPLQDAAAVSIDVLERLQSYLDLLTTQTKARPVYGSLPYRHLNLTAVTPVTTPVVLPAYDGGNVAAVDEDTLATTIAPISRGIAELAESLNWEPAAIYDWIKNNIRTEWYWGCMKGAEDTLRQGAGNDCDQAALLVALLRSSGYPARFVRGVIEFFPDLEAVKTQTGCGSAAELTEFFTHAGIPFSPVGDGTITNFRIEHVWVAAQVPYGNYRGALVDEGGRVWLGLDTSIKNAGYTATTPVSVLDSFTLAGLRDDYLAAVQSVTPLEYLQAQIQAHLDAHQPGTTYAQTLLERSLNTESLRILPAGLQFNTIVVTDESTELPADLVHKVRFHALDGGRQSLFDITLDTHFLSNRSLALTYDPETIEDQEVINAYGGLDNTPGYLIRLRPALRLDGLRQALASNGLASGEAYTLEIEFIAPNATQQVSNTYVNGNLAVLGIHSQGGALADSVSLEDKDAQRLFYESAVDYAATWNQSEAELAELLQLTLVRPIPSLVTIGGVVEVEYLLGNPHGFDFKGIYVDADLRAVETVGGIVLADASDPQVRFMELSALEGSALESRVLEKNLEVESISTTKLIGLARAGSVPMLTINAANAATILPSLPFDASVIDDINQAVAEGGIVTVPDQLVSAGDWTGIGYIKEDVATGESGWMLSGTIAGGMTAWGPEHWDDYYRDRLTHPFSDPANDDPSAAVYIQKVSGSDVQHGTAGEPLPNPLQVVALDMDRRPVKGVQITFTAVAGDGKFDNGQGTIVVETDYSGIASAPFTLGQQTAANPTMWWQDGYTHNMQVGENVINASLPSGTLIRVPFTAYGFPGPPAAIVKTHGDDRYDVVLDWAGFIQVRVDDSYGNPISNLPVDFSVQAAVDNASCVNPNADTRPTVLIDMQDTCIDQMPAYGECSSAAGSKQVITSRTGAGVQVILGGTPEADHPIAVSSGALTDTFTMHTYAFGNCGGWSAPSKYLAVQTSFASDAFGNRINAAPPGQVVPVRARLKMFRENEEEKDYTFSCNGTSKTCTAIVGDRTYYIDTDFTSADVSFGGTAGSAQGDGMFTADYTVAAGVNHINIIGNGSIDYRYSVTSCSDCYTDTTSFSDTDTASSIVYGVEIIVPTDIMVAVDVDGYATCDVPIAYTITPAEYTAGSAGVYIYRDGTRITYIPTELSGTGTATLSRGFLFETGSTYEAEVVLNRDSDSVEIISNRIPLAPGAIKIVSIDVKDGDKGQKKVPVPPGGYATMLATTEPAGRPVVWSIRMNEDGVRAEIDSGSGQIYADPETENGWIVVRATDAQNDCVYKESGVFIGCPSCADDAGYCSLAAASGFVNLSSIDIGMTLGKAKGGQSAGDIFLRADRPSSELATPRSLLVSTLTSEIEERFDELNVIRQIMAPQTFVDIVAIDAFTFTITFYDPADVTGETDGFYDVDPAAVPIATWQITNPDASATTFNRLDVTETRDGDVNAYAYVWDSATSTWSLEKGAGLQKVSRHEATSGSDRIVTETIADGAGVVASKTQTTYHTFAWGEEVTEQVQDPDTAALTTSTAYYTDEAEAGSYGRVSEMLYPDGSWVRHEYDDQGRKQTDIHPWLDAAPGSANDVSRVIHYDYTPVDGQDTGDAENRYSPRTVTETILGTDTKKTYHVYYTNGLGERVEITEVCTNSSAAYGDASNLRTVTTAYPSGTDDAGSGRVKTVEYPDGRLESYTYEYGSYAEGATVDVPGTFTPGAGDYRRETVLFASAASPSGVAFKSTRQVTIYNPLGNALLSQEEVYTGSGFERLSWVVNTYDARGRNLAAYTSAGTQQSKSWTCCSLESEQGTQGEETIYTYDALQRIDTRTKTGVAAGIWPSQNDIVTTYKYDAAGHTLSETIDGGGLSLSTQRTYDLAGRMRTMTDAASLITTYVYDTPARETTVVRPGGGTEITTRYRDGRLKSITGTAVVPHYYEYGVNPDGSTWTRVYEGGLASPKWEQTTVDAMGRTILVESPGFMGTRQVINHYNDQGQLVRIEQTGRADTLIEYDELGSQVRQGMDADRNGLLEPAGIDRITDSTTVYANLSGDWWQQSEQVVYAQDGSAAATTTGINRVRFTGLGSYSSESVSIDAHGNQTVDRTIVDRAAKQVTHLTNYPDSTIDGRRISINGLLMAERNQSGIETTFEYDTLGRQIYQVDPRKGASQTHYNIRGQVDYTEDAASHRTTYTYDTDSGRKNSETNALNKTTRYLYNLRGQVTHTWGDDTYPVQFEYDAYGRKEYMHTYRGGSNWNNVVWPTGLTGTPDTTTWIYDEATGLLTTKADAQGNQTTYAYTDAGQLDTRTWARLDGGNPQVTDYDYHPDTGELVLIDYSDATQDIGFTYDRLGRQYQVTDAVGTRTFAYNDQLQLETETITGLINKTLTRTYATTTVPGRNTGLTLGAGYTVTYGYDTYGRLNTLGWDRNGTAGSATYTYAPDSDLLESLTAGSVQVNYEYEPLRDLRTRIENRYGATLVSRYDYEYDHIRRRTSVRNSGSAFATSAFNRFGYNDRNEVTASNRYLGTNINDLSQPVNSETRIYDYDPIGNRISATEGTIGKTYATNDLNQYDSITTGGTPVALSYDEDGNLIEYDGTSYSYNAENRLVDVRPASPMDGDTRVSFVYDYMGRRSQKTVYTYGSGSWNQTCESVFVYDGWNLIEETTTPAASASTTRFYVWGLDLSQSLQGAGGVGGLVAMLDDNATYNYLYDGNGNVGQLVDAADGSLDARYEYDAFGSKIVATATVNNAFCFSTKYFDVETKLHYYGLRYYSDETGRWINKDPINELGGLNLYVIANNNVIDGWDLLGKRMSGSFKVKGTGHHIVPVELWEMFGFPDEAKEIFDKATINVPTYTEDGKTWKHGRKGHGIKTGYTGHVKDEIAKYINRSGLSGKKLKADEYVELAEGLVSHIKNSQNKYISGFLSHVSDPKKLEEWVNTTGVKLGHPRGLQAVKFSGFKRIEIPRGLKCGRKVPIVKYILLIGVAYLWDADYNNARADGHSPLAAGAIATARAADPGLEMAWDFGWGTGTFINNNIISNN